MPHAQWFNAYSLLSGARSATASALLHLVMPIGIKFPSVATSAGALGKPSFSARGEQKSEPPIERFSGC